MDGKDTIRMLWRRVVWLENRIDECKRDGRPYQYFLSEATAMRHCIELFDCMREANIERAKGLRRVKYTSEAESTCG